MPGAAHAAQVTDGGATDAYAPGSPTMRALFEPPAPGSVDDGLQAYAQYLAARDGAPDFERRTLAHRERDTLRYEHDAPLYDGPFDHALLERQHRSYDTALATPPEMQLLLCFLKVNANEAYAVERVLERPLPADRGSELLRLALLEEGYHTRILLSAARLFGAEVTEPAAPVATTRVLTAGIARLPEMASRPITLAAEVIGIVTFVRTIDAVRRVLRGRPALRDALEERVTEVLVDELGHLSLNRLLATRGTFTALRGIVPAIALGTRGALPEAEALGILPVPVREAWTFDVRSLPAEVRRRAFLA
jgi:hypothetical protein